MRGKALRKALGTTDVVRLGTNVPLITDTTEVITPTIAQEMLKKNKCNRPINWKTVEKYADLMSANEWKLTAQGIVLDENDNILTGQQRLWAVIYSDTNVLMRVSRGNPKETASLLDRGRPQSSRDLASRNTERRHSPTEASIARAICALHGMTQPTTDDLAKIITENSTRSVLVLDKTKGTKKTKSILMILAAICSLSKTEEDIQRLITQVELLSGKLDQVLAPQGADRCWGKGVAFSMAMEAARKCVALG